MSVLMMSRRPDARAGRNAPCMLSSLLLRLPLLLLVIAPRAIGQADGTCKPSGPRTLQHELLSRALEHEDPARRKGALLRVGEALQMSDPSTASSAFFYAGELVLEVTKPEVDWAAALPLLEKALSLTHPTLMHGAVD